MKPAVPAISKMKWGTGRMLKNCIHPGEWAWPSRDPVYFKTIQDNLGLQPCEILFVDDFLDNIEAAKACGWQTHHFPENGYSDLVEKTGCYSLVLNP